MTAAGPIRACALGLAALVAAAAPAPAQQQAGDGAWTTNPALLYPSRQACIAAGACDDSTPTAVAVEPQALPLDWALGLRSGFTSDEDGARFELVAAPSVSLVLAGRQSLTELAADAELILEEEAGLRLADFDLEARSDVVLSSTTTLGGGAALSVSQDRPGDPDVEDNVAEAPVVVSGEVSANASQDLGRLDLEASLTLGRQVYGESVLVDASVVDNAHRNRTEGTVALRAAYALTPIVSAFVVTEAGYQLFDAPSPVLLVKQDGASYRARIGIEGKWQDRLEASASVGLAVRDFDDPGLEPVTTGLVEGDIAWRPTERLEVRASLATDIAADDGVEAAKTTHTLALEASYRATQTLTLRGLIEASRAEFAESEAVERTVAAGLGIDYRINARTSVSADYRYGWSERAPDPEEVEHSLSVGVTFARP